MVNVPWRYYGKNYARGPWPDIAAILMLLLSSEEIEKVFYDGDCGDTVKEFSKENFLEYTRYFLENGNRPYDNRKQCKVELSK